MTMTDDGFVAKIQGVELEAEELVETAKQKFQSNLLKVERDLEGKRSKNLLEKRTIAREKLQLKQTDAKALYTTLLSDAEKASDRLKKDGLDKVSKVMPSAESFFLNDILS